ncbi:F-box only protein 15-like isoform X1 [Solea solea]|uniref:F-box only protein 15-like isoform X1 n=1 Tax=Solea solea TaxID=90069 RepID=UPI00272CA38F|nr:F-box only protein 15-like isoform X1 [Solea solea]
MAAGRGEFYSSVAEGFQRLSALLAPPAPGTRAPALSSRGVPGPGRRQAEPERRRAGGRGRGKKRGRQLPQAEPTAGKVETSNQKEGTHTKHGADLLQVRDSSSKANYLERLPTEILIKILSYLNAPSLFCISHVSKLFHRLANDDVVWQKIYMSEFMSQAWKPRTADGLETKGVAVETEDQLVGHWKKMYFRTVAGQEMDKWRRELKAKSPYTGLPRQTEWVLRNLNMSWELTVYDRSGSESCLDMSRAHFFESSVIVCWNKCNFSNHRHIASIQLHGVRKEAPTSLKIRKDWRSLILRVDRDSPHRVIGKDKLMELVHVSPGVIIGVWRGQGNVAFIMISLHFHRLVEKSLLGSPACPYSGPAERPLSCSWDPKLALHGYTLHFVLHNTGTAIMSGHSRQLSCRTVQIQHGLLELRFINRTNVSQHRSLSGNVNLPWKSDSLEGSVENCCIMTMTLLDESQEPFWCVSSPICIRMAEKPQRSDYSGECFLMDYRDADGKVKMELVWLKEEKQFFLFGLTVYVSVLKVNKHYGRSS